MCGGRWSGEQEMGHPDVLMLGSLVRAALDTGTLQKDEAPLELQTGLEEGWVGTGWSTHRAPLVSAVICLQTIFKAAMAGGGWTCSCTKLSSLEGEVESVIS